MMWPDLEAILVVPSNAHALFARPMVTSPHSRGRSKWSRHTRRSRSATVGGRSPLPPGARIEAVRSERSVKWLRIDAEPFADRLVTKFSLPVTGWRGRAVSAVLEELSITGLGVPENAAAEFGPPVHRAHR